jgi:hypothetical protein
MARGAKLLLAVVVALAGTCFASGANQPRPVNQDIALQKYRIEKALGQEVISWLCDVNDAAAVECDRLADLLLSLEEPDVRSYFLAAQVARLREKPDKAITIIENVISIYPDEKSPTMAFPVRIVGRFLIGTAAKESGDIKRVENVYKAILEELKNMEDSRGKGGLMMICNLYLAEIESLHLKRNDLALARLEAIQQIKKPAGHWGTQFEVYKGWAAYEYTRISKGKMQAVQQLVAHPEVMAAPLVAATQLKLCGLTGGPLNGLGSDKRINVVADTLIDRVVRDVASPIDKSVARLGYGFDQQYKRKLAEAEMYYSPLFEEGSYFSPVAGLYLADCKKAQGKTAEANGILEEVRAKYPGYDSAVAKLKESWQ